MVANAIVNAINRPRSDSQNMQRDGRTDGHPTDKPTKRPHSHPSFTPLNLLQSLESRTSIPFDFSDYVAMQYHWRDTSENMLLS